MLKRTKIIGALALGILLSAGLCACSPDDTDTAVSVSAEVETEDGTEDVMEANTEFLEEAFVFLSEDKAQAITDILMNQCGIGKIENIGYTNDDTTYVVNVIDEDGVYITFTMDDNGYYGYFMDEEENVLYYESDDLQ